MPDTILALPAVARVMYVPTLPVYAKEPTR